MGRAPDPRARTLLAYEAQSGVYLKQWDRRVYKTPPLLAALLRGLPPGALVLDLGCGPGQDCRHLRRERRRAIGLDGTWACLLRARRRSSRLPLVRAEFTRLPFRSASFDGLWAAASLIHLRRADVRAALRQLRALVRSGGRLAATFTHGTGTGFVETGWIPGRYFSDWRKPSLARAVRAAGWEIDALEVVTNRERKGRWLNLMAHSP